jgi:pheromone shutdown protein TraB
VKDITKLKFVIISISTIIGISIIIIICAYNLISANSSQLALYIENLMPNFWIYINGTISMLLALLASY